jgi:hypothetical protein
VAVTEPVVYWFSSPRRANGGPAYAHLTVVDVARSRRTPRGERAPGERVELVATRRGEVDVEFSRNDYFYDAAQGMWHPDRTELGPAATAWVVDADGRRGGPRGAILQRWDGSDRALARRLPAALEGTIERLAGDPDAMRDLGARATRLLLAWAGIAR